MGYTELVDPGKEDNEGAHLRRSATTNAHGLVLGWLAVGGGSRSGVWCIQPTPAVSRWNAESKKVEERTHLHGCCGLLCDGRASWLLNLNIRRVHV